jgi:hypothetical protein
MLAIIIARTQTSSLACVVLSNSSPCLGLMEMIIITGFLLEGRHCGLLSAELVDTFIQSWIGYCLPSQFTYSVLQ